MGKYADAAVEQLANVRRILEDVTDPHHRAILANYHQHLAFEQGGNWPGIFDNDLVVAEPHYQVDAAGQSFRLHGRQAIADWYDSIKSFVAVLMNERIAVADWGFASESDCVEFSHGRDLDGRHFDNVDQPDAVYRITQKQLMFWNYDENAKLIGENIWMVGPIEVVLADPGDLLTKDRSIAACTPWMKPLDLASTS